MPIWRGISNKISYESLSYLYNINKQFTFPVMCQTVPWQFTCVFKFKKCMLVKCRSLYKEKKPSTSLLSVLCNVDQITDSTRNFHMHFSILFWYLTIAPHHNEEWYTPPSIYHPHYVHAQICRRNLTTDCINQDNSSIE